MSALPTSLTRIADTADLTPSFAMRLVGVIRGRLTGRPSRADTGQLFAAETRNPSTGVWELSVTDPADGQVYRITVQRENDAVADELAAARRLSHAEGKAA
ncbi:MAG: hypothetical protein GC208_09540 [Alphaproteobacteria bacterium]|nr:hypothetical protein [Alphaproteobacteria bacterium]